MAFKIAMGAGHGYNTSGKRTPDGSMREWEFNNAVVLYMAQELNDFEGVEYIITHDTTGKTDVSLAERVRKANDFGADVAVSVHANAAGDKWSDANGIETYILDRKYRDAYELALKVQRQLVLQTGLRDRGVKTANYYVLRNTRMTAILCECGFMSNSVEAVLLKSDEYRRKCAKAIVNGLQQQYNLKRKPPKTIPDPVTPVVSGKVANLQKWVKKNGIADGTFPERPVTQAYLWEVLKNYDKYLKKGE